MKDCARAAQLVSAVNHGLSVLCDAQDYDRVRLDYEGTLFVVRSSLMDDGFAGDPQYMDIAVGEYPVGVFITMTPSFVNLRVGDMRCYIPLEAKSFEVVEYKEGKATIEDVVRSLRDSQKAFERKAEQRVQLSTLPDTFTKA